MLRFLLPWLALSVVLTNAQTTTVVNPNGQSVVEVITTDPVGGSPTTIILQTLSPQTLTTTTGTTTTTTTGTSTTSTTATTTTPDVQKGPVGQPAPTTANAGGITPYTYTTVVGGVTRVLTDQFTPTFPATVLKTAGSSGKIWNYDSWLSVYAPTSTSQNTGFRSNPLTLGWWGFLLSCTIGVLAGLQLVLL